MEDDLKGLMDGGPALNRKRHEKPLMRQEECSPQ